MASNQSESTLYSEKLFTGSTFATFRRRRFKACHRGNLAYAGSLLAAHSRTKRDTKQSEDEVPTVIRCQMSKTQELLATRTLTVLHHVPEFDYGGYRTVLHKMLDGTSGQMPSVIYEIIAQYGFYGKDKGSALPLSGAIKIRRGVFPMLTTHAVASSPDDEHNILVNNDFGYLEWLSRRNDSYFHMDKATLCACLACGRLGVTKREIAEAISGRNFEQRIGPLADDCEMCREERWEPETVTFRTNKEIAVTSTKYANYCIFKDGVSDPLSIVEKRVEKGQLEVALLFMMCSSCHYKCYFIHNFRYEDRYDEWVLPETLICSYVGPATPEEYFIMIRMGCGFYKFAERAVLRYSATQGFIGIDQSGQYLTYECSMSALDYAGDKFREPDSMDDDDEADGREEKKDDDVRPAKSRMTEDEAVRAAITVLQGIENQAANAPVKETGWFPHPTITDDDLTRQNREIVAYQTAAERGFKRRMVDEVETIVKRAKTESLTVAQRDGMSLAALTMMRHTGFQYEAPFTEEEMYAVQLQIRSSNMPLPHDVRYSPHLDPEDTYVSPSP